MQGQEKRFTCTTLHYLLQFNEQHTWASAFADIKYSLSTIYQANYSVHVQEQRSAAQRQSQTLKNNKLAIGLQAESLITGGGGTRQPELNRSQGLS